MDYLITYITFDIANSISNDKQSQEILTNWANAIDKTLINLALRQTSPKDINHRTMDDIESFMSGQFTFKKFTGDNSSFSQSWKVNVVKSYRNLLEEIGNMKF